MSEPINFAANVRRLAKMEKKKASLADQLGFGEYNPLHYNTNGFPRKEYPTTSVIEVPTVRGSNIFIDFSKEIIDWSKIAKNNIKANYKRLKKAIKK